MGLETNAFGYVFWNGRTIFATSSTNQKDDDLRTSGEVNRTQVVRK